MSGGNLGRVACWSRFDNFRSRSGHVEQQAKKRGGVIRTFADPAGNVALPANIVPGPDSKLWFTSLGTNRIGRIYSAPDAAVWIFMMTLTDGYMEESERALSGSTSDNNHPNAAIPHKQ
jgi:streptogramin lyase